MAGTAKQTSSVAGRDSVRLPHQVVDYGTGARALRAMREETALLTELTYDGPSDDFAAQIATFHLGAALLTDARLPRLRHDRTPLLAARSGIDHYLVFVYRCGQCHQRIGSDELVIKPGDVGVMDMSCAARTLIVPPSGERFARPISMILPRTVLAPLLPGASALGQQRIRRDSFHGRALRELLLNLRHHAEHIGIAESESAVRAAAALVAGGVDPARGAPLEADAALGAATRIAIESFIERADTPPDQLRVSALCQRFGVSRATLYRMFEADGGLVHRVREHQLRRALGVLTSPALGHRRIVDIALQHGFTTESSFIRAFRRRFGATPGEVRAAPPPAAAGLHTGSRRAASWLMALSASRIQAETSGRSG